MNRKAFARYARYKDSGVEWLGEVPVHWSTRRLKDLIIDSLSYGANESATDINFDHPRFIRITDFANDGTLKDETFKSLSPHIAEKYLLREGDILFARSGATVGKTFQFKNYSGKACYAGYLIRAHPNDTVLLSDFLSYYTKSSVYDDWRKYIVIKATIENISAEKYGFFLFVPLPSLPEQRAIADYLDAQTTNIDRQIELLEQKAAHYADLKQSLINRTVTRGLDPTVPLRDSGVEWIGQIPAHWEVSRIKNLGLLRRGVDLSRDSFEEGDYPVYGSNGIIGYHSAFTTYGPCLTVGRSGSVGEVNYVAKDFWAHNTTLYLQKSFGNHIKFIFYLFKLLDLQSLSVGSAVGTLNRNIVHQVIIAIPPVSEQRAIADYLDTKTTHIDRIIAAINTKIARLQELRKTLINDVVTGKVRIVE